jgi:glycerophosphoryl diester phosphodiesterase
MSRIYRWILIAVLPSAAAWAVLPQSALDEPGLGEPLFVAHAGGRVLGRAYTNSFEALEENYARGFRVFELDFSWTADQQLVLLHDWEASWRRLAPKHWHGRVPNLAEFSLIDSPTGLRLMSLDDLLAWMQERPAARIITDVKRNNIAGLEQIASRIPTELKHRFLVQIYAPEELPSVRQLGFEQVLFTVYRSTLSVSTIERFARDAGLTGLVLPLYRAERGDFNALRGATDLPLLVHTINDPITGQWLLEQGYAGLYTDDLLPRE